MICQLPPMVYGGLGSQVQKMFFDRNHMKCSDQHREVSCAKHHCHIGGGRGSSLKNIFDWNRLIEMF